MPLQTAQPFADAYTQADIPASAAAVRGATWDQALTDLPGPSIIRSIDLSMARRVGFARDRLSRSEADYFMEERGLAGEFDLEDRDYNSLELGILASRKRAELRRREILSRADGSGSSAAGRFAISLAANFLDPIAIGTSFVPVVGQAKYAAMLAKAGSAAGRAGVRAGVGAAEGVVGAALVEPIILGAKSQEQADYTFADSFMNMAIGGVFGGGLHVAGGFIGDRLRPRSAQPNRLAGLLQEVEAAHSVLPVMSEADQALASRVVRTREELQAVHGDILRQANTLLDNEAAGLRATPTPADGPGWARLETIATEQRAGVDAYALRVAADYEPAAVRAEIDRLTNDAGYVAALRSKYRQRQVNDRIARQAKENVVSRRTVLETKLGERRLELEQTQAQVDAHRAKNAADQRLEFIRTFRNTDDARKLLDTLPPEAQARFRARLEAATSEAATLLESPEARALLERHPPASWAVANADPRVREAALRSSVAQAVTDEAREVRPLFDSSTMGEAARRISDPDQRPLMDPAAVTRADEIMGRGESLEVAAVQQQLADTEAQVKAMLDEMKLDDDQRSELVDALREEIDAAKDAGTEAKRMTKTAELLVACSARHAA
jgi:hypothetical protein